VLGPFDLPAAASACHCLPSELCCGALGAREEFDKVRTIHDGTVNNVNTHIRANSAEKTTAPGVADVLHSLLSNRTNMSASSTDDPEDIIMIKADITKAHRRIKVQQKDWKYMVATNKNTLWVNMCGTYGIASAQLYWGRMAALLLRLLYYTCPELIWGFVYVDDYLFLFRRKHYATWGMLVLLLLLAVGCPLSWKKTLIGHSNTWLGFQVNAHSAWAILTPRKHKMLLVILEHIIQGHAMTSLEILQALGRFQWATAAFPLMKPFLQPMYSWQRAVTTKGRPPLLVILLAQCILFFLRAPRPTANGIMAKSTWYGASDAAANETTARIGGWMCSASGEPPKADQALWFSHPVTKADHPWAYDKGKPMLRIAALELYGTLLLFKHMALQQPASTIPLFIPMMTDNQGNAYSILNTHTKKWPCSAIMMELCVEAQMSSCLPAITHVSRVYNTWADDLSNDKCSAFDPDKRLTIHDSDVKGWRILPALFSLSRP
jgi:hypothetical protein